MHSWPEFHQCTSCKDVEDKQFSFCLILVVSGNQQCLYMVTNHLNVYKTIAVLDNKVRIQWSY